MLLEGFEGTEVALLVGKRRREAGQGRKAPPELSWLGRSRLFPQVNRKKKSH